jgi:hypothetical protein
VREGGCLAVRVKWWNAIVIRRWHARLTADEQASNEMAVKLRLLEDSATPMFWYCYLAYSASRTTAEAHGFANTGGTP